MTTYPHPACMEPDGGEGPCAGYLAVAKDAERYRWLRDNGHIAFLRKGEEVDKLVDAEMAKPPVQLEI
jgi:hypothetical protein